MPERVTDAATSTGHGSSRPRGRAGGGLRRATGRGLLVLAMFPLAGAGLGVLWARVVWSPAMGRVSSGSWLPFDERALSMQTAGTSTYVVVAAVGGLVLGVLAALVSTRAELVVLVALLVGSTAAAYVMWRVGTDLGPVDPVVLARTAPDGTELPGDLAVAGASPFLSLPVCALVGLAVVYFLSPDAGRGQEPSLTARSG